MSFSKYLPNSAFDLLDAVVACLVEGKSRTTRDHHA